MITNCINTTITITLNHPAEAAEYIMWLAEPETFFHQGHLCMVFALQRRPPPLPRSAPEAAAASAARRFRIGK